MAPQEERPLLGAGVGLGAWCQMSRGKAIVSSLLREKEECTINFSNLTKYCQLGQWTQKAKILHCYDKLVLFFLTERRNNLLEIKSFGSNLVNCFTRIQIIIFHILFYSMSSANSL